MTPISHLYIWEMVKCLCAHILEFVNFPYSVREKGHLSNFKHVFEQCQPEGEAKWLSPHSAKIIYMLIRADILNKARASWVAQTLKNLPAVWETHILSRG